LLNTGAGKEVTYCLGGCIGETVTIDCRIYELKLSEMTQGVVAESTNVRRQRHRVRVQ